MPTPRPTLAARTALRFALRCVVPALLLLLPMAARALPVGAAGVRLAPPTPGAVRFTVTVPAAQLTRVDLEQGADRLDLEGYDAHGAPGRPGVLSRSVLVAVPPLGEVRVSAVASDLRVHEGVLLAATAALDRDGHMLATARDLAAYGAEGSATPVAARLLEVTWMRNQRVARIELLPVAYEPAARRLTVAGRIDVEVAVTNMGPLAPAAEPLDAFENVYSLSLLNYEQGKLWRRPSADVLVKAAERAGLPLGAIATQAAAIETTSVFAGRTWIKISIQKPGFYAVNYSRLRVLSLFDPVKPAPLDSLRMFTWPGRSVLPEDSYCDSCDYREVSLGIVRDVGPPPDPSGHPEIDGPPDGFFAHNNDAIYFFAQGPDGWDSDMDESRPDTSFITNQYERNSFYYLTVAIAGKPVSTARYPVPPQRIGSDATNSRDVAPGGTETVVTTVPGRLHLEQDNEYWPDASAIGSTLAWEKWFWRSLSAGQSFVHALDVPDADVSQPARFRLRQWGLSFNSTGGCSLPDHELDLSFNSVTFPRRLWNGTTAFDQAGLTYDTTGVFLRTAGNSLALSVPLVTGSGCSGRVDRSGLAFYELYYERKLIPVKDAIEFRTRPGAGRLRYDIGPFVQLPSSYVFDVTDPTRPVLLTGGISAAGPSGFTLSISDTGTVSHRYIVVPDSVIQRATALLPATSLADAAFARDANLRNLRSPQNAADYLVIHYDGFAEAADSLVAWRREHLPLLSTPAPHAVLAVPVTLIYDQFSGGRTDPGALRNFLRAAYGWSKRPLYVTFLGDASFDFKDISGRAVPGQPGCLLPTFENNFDSQFFISRQYATDDWIVNVDDPVRVLPDYLAGRIPAGDAASALAVVTGKILAYERSAPFGEYRNAAILMADDDQQGNSCDRIGWDHLRQTTDLDTAHTPGHIDRQYVYLHTFPSGVGGTKPAARTRLLKDLDGGASLFNYVGHGSPFKMSDEGVFLDSDAGTLSNGPRLSLLVAASCDVGKFNDPTVQSLGERMFMTPTGGSIGVISATELAISTDNARLNGLVYDGLFRRATLTIGGILLPGVGQYHVPMSAALLAAKYAPFGQTSNSRKFQLMGDPATRLNLPKLWTEFTLTDENDQPITQIQRGRTVRFRGQVVDRPGGTAVAMNGVASMDIGDSAPTNTTPLGCGINPLSPVAFAGYRFSAGPMYRGDVTLQAGVFSGRFVVPLDATVGAYGRVRAYLTGATPSESATDGTGDLRVQVSPGTPPAGDTQGPRVSLSFVGGSTNVRPDATLQIDLFDDSGIMTTGHAPQNSIIVTLDGNTTSRIDATPSFRYAADSYQSGTARFQLPGLAPGVHSISVSAADNLATGIDAVQHRSSATLEFQVVDTPPLRVVRSYLFPNPVRSGGKGSGGVFVVDAPGDSINTLLRVYTVAGKLVRTLRQMGGIGQVQVGWDGLDDEGDRLAQGAYLYKVYVSVRDADGNSSPRQKATAEGRFVVLSP